MTDTSGWFSAYFRHISHTAQLLNFTMALCARTGKVFLPANEQYTSGECSCCGMWNCDLGNSRVFRCPSCGLETLRDALNATVNLNERHWALALQAARELIRLVEGGAG